MEKILNKIGQQLLSLKKEGNIDKDNPLLSMLNVMLDSKSLEVVQSLTSNKVSVEDFKRVLENNRKFIFSEEELRQIKKDSVIQVYDDALINELKYYNIDYNNNTNTLFVSRMIGMGTKYYSNFLGIEIKVPSKLSKVDWNKSAEQKNYEEKIKQFKNFAKQRLTVVANGIVKTIEQKELVPTLKRGKQNYTLYSAFTGDSKVLKSFVNTTITLSIDLNKKDNLKANKEIIIKVFNEINDLVEKYMNYELYK